MGLIIDLDRKELSYVINNEEPILAYSDIPDEVHIFLCTADGVMMTFTRHIMGRSSIDKYLKNPLPYQNQYTHSKWVKEHLNI